MDGGRSEGAQGGAVSSPGPTLLLLPHPHHLLTIMNGLVLFCINQQADFLVFFPHNVVFSMLLAPDGYLAVLTA